MVVVGCRWSGRFGDEWNVCSVTENFTAGIFAVGNFAVIYFTEQKFRRTEISPYKKFRRMKISPFKISNSFFFHLSC